MDEPLPGVEGGMTTDTAAMREALPALSHPGLATTPTQ